MLYPYVFMLIVLQEKWMQQMEIHKLLFKQGIVDYFCKKAWIN